MLNEFVYCPRLFFLEWVQGRFEDSDDTVIGRAAHRTVDQERGRAPLPGEEQLKRARSVWLSSEQLSVTARIDVLEGKGNSVIPLDVKKGSPQADGKPWPSDRIQSIVQALILREHGYTCDHAEVYYATPRRRVTVPITDAAASWARSVIDEARRTSDQIQPPPPLIDSPKCTRCSLAGICLPDETNLLIGHLQHAPHRILPRDPDSRPVYVTEAGSTVGIDHGQITVRKENKVLAGFRLIDVSQLALFGRVQVTTQALHELFEHNVPVLWFTFGGWLRGWAHSPPTSYAELRRRQTLAHAQGGLGIAANMITGKIRNCRTLLRRNRADQTGPVDALRTLADKTQSCTSFSTLLGLEGTAARLYFDAFPSLLDQTEVASRFAATGRNRRPPRDPINALLSFCYALLTKDLVATVLGVGLDPYLGIYHRTRHNRPALALDLAEEFRPLIADSVVLSVVNNHKISANDFITRAGGVALTPDGRRALLHAYERRLDTTITHPLFGYQISYRRTLDIQARILAATLIGELPEYRPMTTR
ncbi:CRISPR-associated endonuclease Cas4g/Cas1g [Saccharopolyspora hattusasensis]|uniref:CRISPR-associated endonuclease Cas4g/Cas1g n=1 Tax=Saccharopolyspora hattusasensis TaxID=1128679 RepID=UPI003D975185